MSRTGVGVRVLIDGYRVDDGCIADGTIPAIRHNYCRNPRPSVWSGSGWAMNGLITLPGDDWIASTSNVIATQYCFVAPFSEPSEIGDVVSMRISFRVDADPSPTPVGYIRANVHQRTGNAYILPHYIVPVTRGVEQTVTVTWTVDRVLTDPLEISLTTCAENGSFVSPAVGFEWRVRRPLYQRGPAIVGGFFDGDTADTAAEEFGWLGAVHASASEARPNPNVLFGLTAEQGLRITWGRKTTVEQPSPSTCTFRIMDDPSGVAFMDRIRIGSRVQVFADGDLAGEPIDPAFADPGFETEVRGTPRNAVLSRSQRQAAVGSWAACLSPVNPDQPWSASFPPATLQPAFGDPGAWDGVPQMGPGQTWTIEVRVYLPAETSVRVRPVVYAGPYANAATIRTETIGTATAAGWNTIRGDFIPGDAAGWLGFNVEASGGGRWIDVAPAITWADIPPETEWRDLSDVYVDAVAILAPAEAAKSTTLAFEGRVTDMAAAWDDGWDMPGVDVTATDFLGDLGNRYVGDSVWAAEPIETRVRRVLDLATIPTEPVIVADIAPTLVGTMMTLEEVDHAAASGLLTDMSQSVDGVLWSATHIATGPYVKIEDPAARLSLYELRLVDGVIVIAIIDYDEIPIEDRPPELSACDVLRDPVTFLRDVSDIATRVSVGWKFQTVDDEGIPTTEDRTFVRYAPDSETLYGTRNMSLDSMLTTQPDAAIVADQIIARLSGQWRVEGIVVADADFRTPDRNAAIILLGLLNGVRRGGLPMAITDMPSWSPLGETIPAYLEGGEYAFTGGGWELALTVSRANGIGSNATWDDIPRDPGWIWDAWNPSITWDQLRGVAGP